MRNFVTGSILASLLMGCGAKKHTPPPTEYEQKSADLEEAIGVWERRKAEGKVKNYSYVFFRKRIWVEVTVDATSEKPMCRQLFYVLAEDEPNPPIEKGPDVNKNDWGGAPKAWTMPELHEECRRVVKENPSAWLGYTWGGALLWCEGAWGYKENEGVGLRGWGTDSPSPECVGK